jgi:hypothetical protein
MVDAVQAAGSNNIRLAALQSGYQAVQTAQQDGSKGTDGVAHNP